MTKDLDMNMYFNDDRLDVVTTVSLLKIDEIIHNMLK